MLSEGWGARLATILTIIIMIIFTVLCFYWQINFFDWIIIAIGGSVCIWWLIILLINTIQLIINFIKTGRI